MTKTILYLSPYFWPEEIGSAPYCTDLARYLQGAGHRLHTIAFRPHYPTAENFRAWSDGSRDEETFENIKVSRIGVSERGAGGFKERVKNDIRFVISVCRKALLGRFSRPDVVIAYVPSILTVFAALLVKLISGAQVLTIVHDIESGLARSLGIAKNRLILRMMERVESFVLNRSDRVVVLTEGMKSELEKIGCTSPIDVISIWASPASESPIPVHPPTLMYSGNFGKKQNLDQLLPLIKRLSLERADIKVVMQGDGSEKERIVRLFQQAGVTNTRFSPLVDADKFVPSLQAATLHMVPQAQDVANYALPSKLFSIMAAGRPYVCIAEAGSPLDVLTQRSGAGICVSPGDEDGLFEAVTGLLDRKDELERKGVNGRTFVAECMNKQSIMNRYLALIGKA